jgi:adenylate cyclase
VNLYELIDSRDVPLDPATEDFLGLYAEARNAYTSRRFEASLKLFEQAQRLRPIDKAVKVHINRAKQYLIQPPPDDWDGVHIMTTK